MIVRWKNRMNDLFIIKLSGRRNRRRRGEMRRRKRRDNRGTIFNI